MPHSFAHQEGREGSFDPINAEENRLNKVFCLLDIHCDCKCARVCVCVWIDDEVVQRPQDESNTALSQSQRARKAGKLLPNTVL